MKRLAKFLIVLFAACFLFTNAAAQKKKIVRVTEPKAKYKPLAFTDSAELQTLVNRATTKTIDKFAAKGFKAENLAVTLIDLSDSANLKMAQFNGEAKIYPASVVKLFYLAAIHRWLEDGRVTETPELRRGVKDMIVDSSNEATQYIIDVISGVSSGAELPPKEFEAWAYKRNAVNRYFSSLGYQNINVNMKTFCEDAYGREQQFREGGKNRNKLTTNATARLLAEIVLGKAVSAERSRQMLDLMKRDFTGKSKDPDDQAHGFTAIALNDLNLKEARLWSKAGWTSTTRHDTAYIETPGGLRFVLVTFTTDFANERDIIPSIAKIVLEGLKEIK